MASRSEKDFAKRINQRAANIEPNVWRIMRYAALAIHREVILGTPVDTGKARSNWIIGVGRIPSTVINPHHPGKHLGIGERANAHTATFIGMETLHLALDKPNSIYIVNNVHYINKLNRGHSSQAGPAFVERAVMAGVMTLDQRTFKVLD